MELTKNKSVTQRIQSLLGEFTHEEACLVLMNLINKKINAIKIQKLQMWEGNHNCNTADLDARITGLEKEKKEVHQFLSKRSNSNSHINAHGKLEISDK